MAGWDMKKGWSLGVRIQPAVNFALKMWFGVIIYVTCKLRKLTTII